MIKFEKVKGDDNLFTFHITDDLVLHYLSGPNLSDIAFYLVWFKEDRCLSTNHYTDLFDLLFSIVDTIDGVGWKSGQFVYDGPLPAEFRDFLNNKRPKIDD